MPEPFRHSIRVRYAECDPQAIAFNAHYLAWFDLALTELWRERCGGYPAMVAGGTDMVVAEATVRYRTPARFDDVLDLEVVVSNLGTTSLVTAHTIRRGAEPCAEGELRHVFVDLRGGGTTSIPEPARSGLAGLVGAV